MKKGVPGSFLNSLWKFITSVRLTIIILLTLAITSIIGTVIPQNVSPHIYFREYGEFLFKIFNAFGIFDMYHSWWFQFLLLFLTLNIVFCSIDRLSATWKIVFNKMPAFHISRFRRLSGKKEFTTHHSSEDLKKLYETEVSKHYRYSRFEQTNEGFCIFAEKGRWTRLGVYAVHLSVILMILGGLIGSIFGFTGFVNIPEGEKINSIHLKNTGKLQPLDFEIRCDDFDISFYDSGAPREYRSQLTIIEQGEPVLKKDVIVNDPLRYRGINIFQANYGAAPPSEINLNFKSRKTGVEFKNKAIVGQQFELPEGKGTFMIKNYSQTYSFKGHDLGESLFGVLTPTNGRPIDIIIPFRYPNFDKMRGGEWAVTMTDYERHYFTGLQITKDPGVLVVYSGFIMMIIGCFITFFMSHQRICIEVIKHGGKSRVMVAGIANKNKIGMQNKIERFSQTLINLS